MEGPSSVSKLSNQGRDWRSYSYLPRKVQRDCREMFSNEQVASGHYQRMADNSAQVASLFHRVRNRSPLFRTASANDCQVTNPSRSHGMRGSSLISETY